MNAIRHLVVSVPANNEEALLGQCLASVTASVKVLLSVRPAITVSVCVALDRCTDRSADVAAGYGVSLVCSDSAGVGAARDAAIRLGLSALAVGDLQGAWLACTDADTIVRQNWLVRHVMWAERGLDLVVGTVEPRGAPDSAVLAGWHSLHQLVEGHPHVHGANLGVRASQWRRAGGFGNLTVHEDVDLVARIKTDTARWVATDTLRVRTSDRLNGRAEGGFATYLSRLDAAR